MKTTTLFSAALVSTALAQPHGHSHHHHARHQEAHGPRHLHGHGSHDNKAVQKRALFTEWVTAYVTETVTEYYDMTETAYSATGGDPTSSSSKTTVPAQFFEGASSSSAKAPAAPATTASVVPVVSVPSQAPAADKPSTTQQPAAAPTTSPTPQQSQAAAPSAASVQQVGSTSGGQAFTGEVTHYTVGLGACGNDDSGKDRTDYIVALSHELMTSGTWPDAKCGSTVTFSYGGKTITAAVHDKCPSCNAQQIDVSEKLFLELFGDLGVGRARGVSWTLKTPA